jgi:alpha-glucosidase
VRYRGYLLKSLALAAAATASAATLRSPDGAVAADLWVKDGCATYSVSYRGKPVIAPSRLGLELEGEPPLGCGVAITKDSRERRRGQWSPPYGERKIIPDNFNQAVFELRDKNGRRFSIVLRAYNEGAALRYALPKDGTIARERTEFRFPSGTVAWQEHGTEGEYQRVAVENVKPKCERPLTLELGGGGYAALFEAAAVRYARMLLSPHEGGLVSDIDGSVRVRAPFNTPWRGVIAGARPGELMERNYLLLNLNEPQAFADTSWIKPGKAIREVTLSTKGGMECVDFAARHNLQYVEYDAGWYGHEYDDASDATRVSLDPKRVAGIPNHGGLDLKAVIEYGHRHGVGVILYVNRRALERQLDRILPLYAGWGVKGIKFGFVQVGPQNWTEWLYDAVRKAAEHKLIVDVHDSHRPTGVSRTYPNLLTQEGIRGNEHMPTATHNTTLPFTRYTAGAGDYTICYYSPRIKTTHAHQLAMSVVTYSPLQFLFWYDRPSAYRGEPEIEFFERVPTVWDDTRVLDGRIGEHAVVARRSGNDWFLGAITNESARELSVPLDFLEAGRKYTAEVYSDSPDDAPGRPRVAIERREVSASTVLALKLAASGGCAVRFAPKLNVPLIERQGPARAQKEPPVEPSSAPR